jgi:hypothetical protein
LRTHTLISGLAIGALFTGCATNRQAARGFAVTGAVSLFSGAYLLSSTSDCVDGTEDACSYGDALGNPIKRGAGYAFAATGAIELVTALIVLAMADDTWLDAE